MKKIFLSLFSLLFLITPLTALALDTDFVGITGPHGLASTENSSVRLSSKSPIEMTLNLINFSLTFLGIIAVVIILFGGFKWMTSMGSSESIKKAKELMTAGIIGLVIILASWGITYFIIKSLAKTI